MIDLIKLTKEQIITRAKWKCPVPGHSKHNGLEHPRCYDRLQKIEGERIGFLDIETEDLKADFGIMFCWCVLDAKTDKIISDIITPDDIKKYSSHDRDKMPKEDTRILKSLIDTLQNYDRLVGHYSSRFDLQFSRTRSIICDVPFPHFGEIYQSDTWMILKHKFKLSRNSQENATRKLLGATRKDHLSLSIKHGCLRGEKWALDSSLEHCKKDVLDLRDLYNTINPYAKKTNTSI